MRAAMPQASLAARASPQVREVVVCGCVAAALSTLVVLTVPRGGDLAAHLYRTGLVQHGILVWDNLWFAGQYPLSSYSLLYYLLAAVVGNTALGIGGVVAAAAVFASIAHREWKAAGRWPARAFAVLVTGQAFTAAYPYDVGLATLAATLWAVQRRRPWLAAVCTVLTLGFSPLAFVFLTLALLALFLRSRRITVQALVVGGAVAASGGIQLLVLATLPSPGLVYPYGLWRLLAGLAVAALGVAVAVAGRGGWRLASFFVVWAAATVVADVVPSPVGHNLIRASVFVPTLMLVGAALADFRPRWLTIGAVVTAFAANMLPYAAMVSDRSSSADSSPAFWQPVLAFLHDHSSPAFRVEVVPTANHWEAYFLPHAGIALARGWYRQLDIADNGALYGSRLTPAQYRAWLHARGVHYVVLPHLALEATDAFREASLVRAAATGLERVASSGSATIYALRDARPILTGEAPAGVTALGSSRIDGWVARPGRYLLRLHFTPYLKIVRGSICLGRAPGSMTRLVAASAGRFEIQAVETLGGVLQSLLDADTAACS